MKDLVEEIRGAVRHWWTSLIIGLLAVVLGVWCIFTPMATLGALTMLFIAAFLVSGLFEIIFAVGNRRHLRGWGWALTGGIVDMLLGIMLAAAPAPAATAVLVYFVGFWIMLRSLWAIGGASELSALGVRGWGWLLALAIASFIFSLVFIFSSPIFGGTFVVAFFSTAMIVYGIFRIWLALKLKAVKDAAMPE